MTSQILGVLVGGGVAIMSGLVVAVLAERRARSEWRRKARLDVAKNSARALQGLNREVVNLAISNRNAVDGTGPEWDAFYRVITEWNACRHEAALMSSRAEIDALAAIDDEVDRLIELAASHRWSADDFRRERVRLGQLASIFLATARSSAGEGTPNLDSVWIWPRELSGSVDAPPHDGSRETKPT